MQSLTTLPGHTSLAPPPLNLWHHHGKPNTARPCRPRHCHPPLETPTVARRIAAVESLPGDVPATPLPAPQIASFKGSRNLDWWREGRVGVGSGKGWHSGRVLAKNRVRRGSQSGKAPVIMGQVGGLGLCFVCFVFFFKEKNLGLGLRDEPGRTQPGDPTQVFFIYLLIL